MTDMIILFICGAINVLSRSFCILEIAFTCVRVIQKKYQHHWLVHAVRVTDKIIKVLYPVTTNVKMSEIKATENST